MKNIKNKFVLKIFWGWTVWVIIYAIVFNFQENEVNFLIAFINSAQQNYLFALIAIVLWKLCKFIPIDRFSQILFFSIHLFFALMVSAIWTALIVGLWYITVPEGVFEQIQVERIIGWQFLFGIMYYFFVVAIFYTIIYYRNFKEKELTEAELKSLTVQAELKALKLQMNPHFLFNSLNSINALVTQNPGLARKMITQLSELLRMSLELHSELFITLKQELDFVHKYLEIEQIRFNDKMIFEEHIDNSILVKEFPAMLIQPLIENAVKYGVAESVDGGKIFLEVKQNNDNIRCVISNEFKTQTVAKNNNGTAIKNINERLKRLYGNNYFWKIDHTEQNIFQVEFEIPIKNE